jgi:ADP-heptose:LPS heptosyltransferase
MLRTYKFDTAIILHPSPFIHLLTVLVGIKNRFGLSRGGKKFFLTSSIDENGSYDYYYPMNFLKVVNLIAGSAVDDKIKIDIKMQVFPHSHDRDVVADLLKIQHVNDLSKLIIISPGGAVNPKESISARVWPWENYAELIRLIIKENSHYSIILTGGNKDKEIISRIHEKEPQAIDLSGKTNIQELISLVGLSQCVICNDSSVLHISIAQNRPTIGIFGPTSIKSRVPPSHIENCVQSAENCSPCYHFGSYPGCNKNALCMRSILPEMVYKKVKKILFSE